MAHRLLYAALCALLLFAPVTHAGTDPERSWQTIRTEHFAIHTYDGGVPMAHRVAAYAEEAWRVVGELLQWTPSEVVHIKLVDSADVSNGLAGVIP